MKKLILKQIIKSLNNHITKKLILCSFALMLICTILFAQGKHTGEQNMLDVDIQFTDQMGRDDQFAIS